jgi:predicted nucleic acid-binding protein
MPPAAHSFSRVVLDTSVFRRFDDAGRLILLAPYFQQRKIAAEITLEVRNELVIANKTTTLNLQSWPEVVELPPNLQSELLRRMRASQKPGDSREKNAGEISAVLYAKHCGATLVVAEDHLAKQMCRDTDLNVPRLSTAHLVLEMVEQGYLVYDDAWSIWDRATPGNVGVDVFHQRLRAAGLGKLVPRASKQAPGY